MNYPLTEHEVMGQRQRTEDHGKVIFASVFSFLPSYIPHLTMHLEKSRRLNVLWTIWNFSMISTKKVPGSFFFATVDHFFARGNHHATDTSWQAKQPQGLQVFIQINAFRKKKTWKTRNLINVESFSWNKNLNAQKKLAKENESCQNYRLQVVVNHYTCNRSASWPLNLRQATKIKINIVRV